MNHVDVFSYPVLPKLLLILGLSGSSTLYTTHKQKRISIAKTKFVWSPSKKRIPIER